MPGTLAQLSNTRNITDNEWKVLSLRLCAEIICDGNHTDVWWNYRFSHHYRQQVSVKKVWWIRLIFRIKHVRTATHASMAALPQVNNKLATYECHKSVKSLLQFSRDNLTDAATARIPLPPNKYIVFFKMTKERGKSTHCVFVLPDFCGAAQGQPVCSQSKAELERLNA